MRDRLGGVMAFPVLRLIMMSRVSLADVNAGLLRALGRQRALRALGGFVGLRVRGVGHRLVLMSAAVDLQRHVSVGFKRKSRRGLLLPSATVRHPRNCDRSCGRKCVFLQIDSFNFSVGHDRWVKVLERSLEEKLYEAVSIPLKGKVKTRACARGGCVCVCGEVSRLRRFDGQGERERSRVKVSRRWVLSRMLNERRNAKETHEM